MILCQTEGKIICLFTVYELIIKASPQLAYTPNISAPSQPRSPPYYSDIFSLSRVDLFNAHSANFAVAVLLTSFCVI